jgi:hypothetical protein
MKTNIQTNPKKYTDPTTTFNLLMKENGIPAFFAEWVPAFVGLFTVRGLSYALTEFFRRFYFDFIGDITVNYEIPIIVAATVSICLILSKRLITFAEAQLVMIASSYFLTFIDSLTPTLLPGNIRFLWSFCTGFQRSNTD